MREPNGLLAAGRDLSAGRLLEAYAQGIFPWFSDGQPVLWWSPDPRMVLFIDEFKISRSLAKTLRRLRAEGRWRVTKDAAFERVMRECAAPRPDQDGTWITDGIVAAYCALHALGLAHSVEVWSDDALIGGLYGVGIGRMFYGESMFARATDASKVALSALVSMLREADFRVIDCQQNTRHLASLGAREIGRSEFLHLVSTLTALPPPDWRRLSIEIPYA
jgi:leucyl/phenylalanyl-tRNA--protein transferase